ncbi:stromal membrane-associated protein [Geosmithia morbida]|uniref:Stromal membrane-associated protein n=1 Tax=Geosmithia morbida TaxID=1094350 RepID=A0A9P5D1J5_9HYPO|nr:stromal membrane-associated protein [Geosmithia morbida]KAF4122822.1 stromal membrane-associated protein [Geosmithia morbida]
MSRRAPNPAAERAAQNQATIKSLLKLEPNKICADCKKNKHPRWASWNLGVFICIRCSGIHRGMGTHISRVKSVDLDSWTDQQMQSVLSWGNARANKFWEAKLSPGHVPSDSKIENFIRTKYELKRWAMDGPIPDPATLDAGADDDIPLSVVKEKQTIERRESARRAGGSSASAPSQAAVPAPVVDLIGGSFDSSPARSSSAGPSAAARVPPRAEPAAAPPKPAPSNSSLLGLDFLGDSSAPQRPASTTGVSAPGSQSRPDLKQSILSLYASAPKPQPQQQPQKPQHGHQGSFGGMTSPQQGGFNDAFSSLSIGGNTTSPKPAAADPFASFGSASAGLGRSTPTSNNSSSFGGLGSGSFFDPKPAAPAPVSSLPVQQRKPSDGGFGDFGSFTSAPAPAPTPAAASKAASTFHTSDLFDLSAPTTTTSPPPSTTSPPAFSAPSVFDLSASQKAVAAPPQPKPAPAAVSAFGASSSALSGADVWGSGNEWATPEPAVAPAPVAATAPSITPVTATANTSSTNDFGWGSSFSSTPIIPGAGGGFNPAPPKVTADEEFGGWSSSTGPSATTTTAAPKPATGMGGAEDDLFSNVWQ